MLRKPYAINDRLLTDPAGNLTGLSSGTVFNISLTIGSVPSYTAWNSAEFMLLLMCNRSNSFMYNRAQSPIES
jgi:hypothetical protein